MTPLDLNRDAHDGAPRLLSEINVTPFIDVMLVLLIIFMVAAPLMMVGVPLKLPKTAAQTVSQPKKPVVLSLTKDGRLFIADQEIAADRLVERLAQTVREDPETIVYVRGDNGLEYGRVMEVLGKVGQAGVVRLSLLAEGQPQPAGIRP